MIAPRPLVAIAILFLSLTGIARGEADDPSPTRLLAELQKLQTKIAQGDKEAYAAQPAMLHDMGAAFASASPEVWRQPDNIHAAVAFLLSGGPPRAVASLLQVAGVAKEDDRLLRGALAYVVGREDEAQAMLGGFDAKTLDLRLAGQVAFVQSMLLSSKDKKKAIELLDLARVLTPGGLVEEAALRRETSLAGEMRDVDRFTLLACQYLNRFSKSLYAESFVRNITSTAARLGLAEDLANFRKFDALVAALPADTRRGFYLAIARAALVDGKAQTADVAARMSLAQASGDVADETRGRFYGAAARVLGESYDQAVVELNAIDAKKLPKRDVALLAAARDVAARLREEPPMALAPKSTPAAAADSTKGAEGAMATIRLAEAAVARSDSLIGGKPR
jgi:chemotaxis protein MotC